MLVPANGLAFRVAVPRLLAADAFVLCDVRCILGARPASALRAWWWMLQRTAPKESAVQDDGCFRFHDLHSCHRGAI